MTPAQLIDITFLAIACVVPPVLVFRYRWGFLWGALAVWAALLLAGVALELLDPASRTPWTTFFNLLWLIFGGLAGLAYCAPFLLIKILYRRVQRGRAE